MPPPQKIMIFDIGTKLFLSKKAKSFRAPRHKRRPKNLLFSYQQDHSIRTLNKLIYEVGVSLFPVTGKRKILYKHLLNKPADLLMRLIALTNQVTTTVGCHYGITDASVQSEFS